ncbi:hypothetical protein C8R43DRAFT_1109881 [Mycena crocata]|nr:hypothetical protein C8R43DRAFT_1109881 [Mycena crocata]
MAETFDMLLNRRQLKKRCPWIVPEHTVEVHTPTPTTQGNHRSLKSTRGELGAIDPRWNHIWSGTFVVQPLALPTFAQDWVSGRTRSAEELLSERAEGGDHRPRSRREGHKRNAQHRLEAENSSLREERSQLVDQNRQCVTQVAGLKDEMQKMRLEMSRLAQENAHHVAQLEAQKREVFGKLGRTDQNQGQGFGATLNGTSTADVRRMLQDLESETFQMAAGLSEFDFRTKMRVTGPLSVDSELMERMLGRELLGLLLASGKGRPVPAMVVQIALQTAMAWWTEYKLHSWILKANDHSIGFWRKLHAQILRSEESQDAARWRAITRKQLNKLASLSDVQNSLLVSLVDVLILTKPMNEPPSRRTIEAVFGDRIAAIARLVLQLNKAVGTEVVSEDLEAVTVIPGGKFEPKTMENMWAEDDDTPGAPESVICTTALGLRMRRDNGRDGLLIMKPKVLLPSILKELMG